MKIKYTKSVSKPNTNAPTCNNHKWVIEIIT